MTEPVEITELETLRERIKQSGIITITRGLDHRPIAHAAGCPQLAPHTAH